MIWKSSSKALAVLALAVFFPLVASAQSNAPQIEVVDGHHGGMGFAPFPIPEGLMDNNREFTIYLTEEQLVSDPNGFTITTTVIEPAWTITTSPAPSPTNTVTVTECCYSRVASITATITNNYIEAKTFAQYTISIIMIPGLSVRLTAFTSNPPTLVAVDFFQRFQAVSMSNTQATLPGSTRQVTVHHYGVGVRKFPSAAAYALTSYSSFDYETEDSILLLFQAGTAVGATQVSVGNVYEPFPSNLAAVNKISLQYVRRGGAIRYRISDRAFNVDQLDRNRLRYSAQGLPSGISISSDGVVAGAYNGVGNFYPATIQVLDSQSTLNRAIALMTIISDTESYFDTKVSVSSSLQLFSEGVLPQGRSRVTVDSNGAALTVYDPHILGSFTYERKGLLYHSGETFSPPTLRLPPEVAVLSTLVTNVVENTLVVRALTVRNTTTIQTGSGPQTTVSVSLARFNLNKLVRSQKYVFDISLKQGATLDYETAGQPYASVTVTTNHIRFESRGDQTYSVFYQRRQTIALNAYANVVIRDGKGTLTAAVSYAIGNLYEGGLEKIDNWSVPATLLNNRNAIDLIFEAKSLVRLDEVGGTAPIHTQGYGERLVAQEITIRGGTTLSTFITVEVPANSGRTQRIPVVTAIQGGTTLEHISVEPRGVVGKEIVTLIAYTDPWPWSDSIATRVTVQNGQSVTVTMYTGNLNPYANSRATASHNRYVQLTTTVEYLRMSAHVNRDDTAGGVSGGFLRYMNLSSYDTEARICFGDGSANSYISAEVMGGAARLEPITEGARKGCHRVIQVKSIGSVAAASVSVSQRGRRGTTELVNVPVKVSSPVINKVFSVTLLMPAQNFTFPHYTGRGGPVTVEAGVYFERLYSGIRSTLGSPRPLTISVFNDGRATITEDTGAGVLTRIATDSRTYMTIRAGDDGLKMFGTVPQPGTTYAGIAFSLYTTSRLDGSQIWTAPVTLLFTVIATEASKPTIGIAGIQTLELRSTTTLARGIDTGIEITVAGAGNRAISSLAIKSAYQRFFTLSPTLRDVAAGTTALQLKAGVAPVFPTVAATLPLTIVATDLSGFSSSLTVSLTVTEDELDFNLGLVGRQTVRLKALERPFAADEGTGFTLLANPQKDVPITLVSVIVQTTHKDLLTVNATTPISSPTRLELQVRQGATLAFKSANRITVSVVALGDNKSATVQLTLHATTGLEANRAPRISRVAAPADYALGDSVAATASADVPTEIIVHIEDDDLELEESTSIPALVLQTHSDKFRAAVQSGSDANAASYRLYVKQSVELEAGVMTMRMIARDVDQAQSAPRTYQLRVTVDGVRYDQQAEVSIIHNEVTPVIVREIMHLNDLQLSEHVAGLRSRRDRGLVGMANQEDDAVVAALRDMVAGRERDLEEGKLSFKEFIAGQSFSLPLSQGSNGNGGLGFGMWGRGDYTKLSQDLKEDGTGMKFEGDIVSGSLGLEGLGRNFAGGLGIGYHQGEFDLTLTARQQSKPIDYNLDIYTVNPYMAVFLGDESSVWASFSYGQGDVELVADNAEIREASHYRNKGELTSMGYSVGGSSDVLALLNHQGPHSLDLRLQYSASTSEFTNRNVADGQVEIDDIADIEGKSLRFGMKYKAALALGEDNKLVPSFGVYGRRNSTEEANVDAVSGYEAITGLAFQGSNLGMEFQGRYLKIAELDAYGGNLKFAYSSVGSGGLGLKFSMTPAYGGLGTGEALFDAAKISDLTVPGKVGLRMGSEASYGMAVPYGLLTPYAGYRLSDASTDEYTLGMRYNYGFSKFGLNLQGAQGRDHHDLKVEYYLEFQE